MQITMEMYCYHGHCLHEARNNKEMFAFDSVSGLILMKNLKSFNEKS